MTIPKYMQDNFNYLLAAAHTGKLCIMECQHKTTKELHPVLAVVTVDAEDEERFIVNPVGVMFKFSDETEEPMHMYQPPYDNDGSKVEFDQSLWMVPPPDSIVRRGN